MKYIRTKDNIYELNPTDYESPMCLDGKTITTCVYTKNQEWVAKSDILKQADTIKDLCDELVIDDKTSPNNKPYIYCKSWDNVLTRAVGKHLDFVVGKGAIYGAILTNRGIIYVAKMNEKGELELI